MLLIHTCCADCILRMLASGNEELSNLTKVSLYYYAPNIHPRNEYLFRLNAIKKAISQNNLACKLIVADYQPKDYFLSLKKQVKDLIFPSKNERCHVCWKLRLEKSFIFAKENGFEQLTSTMLSSCYMNRLAIIKLGKELAKQYEIEFLIPEISCQFLATKGFYKQNYCGCCYSLVEKMREKYS